jgi:non-ribosomal peptide synthetase component F
MEYAKTPWSIDKESGEILAADGRIAVYLSVKEMDNDFALAQLIVRAVNHQDDLVATLKKAELTYAALERNADLIVGALQSKGYPSSWFLVELNKAKAVRLTISKVVSAVSGQ